MGNLLMFLVEFVDGTVAVYAPNRVRAYLKGRLLEKKYGKLLGLRKL